MTSFRDPLQSYVMATRDAGTRATTSVAYDMKLAGRKVRHAREDLGISAVMLAEILTDNTPDDWSHDMIRNLESGRRRIDPPLLRVLSEQLGRPVEYFLYQNPYNAPAAATADIPR